MQVKWRKVDFRKAGDSCIYKKITFERFIHVIIEAGKSRICRVGWQAGDRGEASAVVEVQRPPS